MRYFLLSIIMLLAFSAYSFSQTSSKKFIDKYNTLSISLSKEYKIPTSVILSISMWESGSGTSKLSRNKHNYFGIKQGRHYRGYENDSASFRHFCEYVSKRKYYRTLVDNNITDYKKWIQKIQSGGYSQTKKWPNMIIMMIKKNNLSDFDNQTMIQ